MGGTDKALIDLGGQPLLKRVSERLQQQVPEVILSVNAPSALHKSLNIPMLSDTLAGYLGPLAGIHTALNWAHCQRPNVRWVMTVAVDTPFFPDNMVETLHNTALDTPQAPIICSSAGRSHNAFGLWPVMLRSDLEHHLKSGGRSLRSFLDSHPPITISFKRQDQRDPFFNINSPEDISYAKAFPE